MSKTTLNLRVDSALKKEAEKVIDRLGISMSSAIVLYLNALVRENGIPFDIKANDKLKHKVTKEGSSKTTKTTSKKKAVAVDREEDEFPGFDSIKAALSKF